MKLEVFYHGLIIGAVSGLDRIDARMKVRKYFPDATSVRDRDKSLGFLGHSGMVWINDSFALFVDGYSN